jgi:hypothetical protein
MSNYAKADCNIQWYENKYPGAVMNLTAKNMVLVLHTTETSGWPTYSGGSMAPNYTGRPPVGKITGAWRGHFPDERSSRALENRPGGVETNTQNDVQVELMGTCDPKHRKSWNGEGVLLAGVHYVYWAEATDAQLAWLADFIADQHKRHGLSLTAPARFNPYPSSYGTNQGDRLTFDEWNKVVGIIGHQHVPENSHGDPGFIDIQHVIELAKGLVDPMPVPDPTPGETVTQVPMIHWNVAGSDTVNGYGASNSYRGDDLARYVLKLGFMVFLTCESGQKSLLAGINSVLAKFHPYSARAKSIWYDSAKVKNIKSRKLYSCDPYSYLSTKKWGMAFFGEKDLKKFAVLEIHTDYRKPAKQAKQVQAIFKKFRADCDLLGIKHVNQYVCGDFNWDGSAGDNPFKALATWNFEEKGSTTAATFLDGRHLDGILAHKNATVKVVVEPRTNGKMRLSDHHPIKFTPTLQ